MIELSTDDKKMISAELRLDEINLLYRSGKMTIHVPTRTYRKIAQSNPRYQGQTAAQWAGSDGQWRDVWLEKTPPAAAKVGVFVQGYKEPCWGVALASEWSSGGGTWEKKPAYMLELKAEGLALKKFVNITGADAAIDADDPVDDETEDSVEVIVPEVVEATVETEEETTESLVDRCKKLAHAIRTAETVDAVQAIVASDDMKIVSEENQGYFGQLVKVADTCCAELKQP